MGIKKHQRTATGVGTGRRKGTGILLGAGILAALLTLLSGCGTWRVTLPEEVHRPAHVLVTRSGSHTRLTLPLPQPGAGVEYGFGDWQWYARENRGAWSALRALFLPADAVLSRRPVRRPMPAFPGPSILEQGGYLVLEVEAARIEHLRQALEETWQALDGAEEVVHPFSGTVYRRMPEPYHVFNNSNARSAAWLEALGCEVTGFSFWAEFEIVEDAVRP